jgi:adenine/guanine phosphoribosyltransferase-like PRPP-binding protein
MTSNTVTAATGADAGASLAAHTIGLTINAPAQPLAFDTVLSVALRKNPRRAHLLVSHALGKHTPQRPDIIDLGARLLAEKAHAALVGAADTVDVSVLADALIRNAPAPQITPRAADAVVVGFAEAATALGATVADHLSAYYVCSTRTPTRTAYGQFSEEHSHASEHFLTPSDAAPLSDNRKPVVLVDDELTTGRTAMNLIRVLHAEAAHPQYIIATLADLRDAGAHDAMVRFAEELGVPVTVVSLFAGHLTTAPDAIERAAAAIDMAPAPARLGAGRSTVTSTYDITTATPHARDGVMSFVETQAAAQQIAVRFANPLASSDRRVLVLGVEEDMMLALQVARALSDDGAHADFSSTTRSPVAVIDHPGYPIRNAITFTGMDGAPRFVYNIDGRYDSVLIVTTDPMYETNTARLAAALHGAVDYVTIVRGARALREPLRGPAFGSYDAQDVAWLLKDLSDTDLEVDLLEREQRVQTGGHYAESLPVEYQPDDEYMRLFWDAVDRNSARVARDIARVGNRILAARDGHPVLVSLARAGTPVGVLLRRYIQHLYHQDVPHYAVSIVRGRGIDHNALRYLAAHHDPADVMFVDGWTGKGAIKAELDEALREFHATTGIRFPEDLAVLSDVGQVTSIYGSRDDYLIPSAALNSTVSGLISRTVLNDDLIGDSDYHGAKFYRELADVDVSQAFVDRVAAQFPDRLHAITPTAKPTWLAWDAVERISEQYEIGSVNLVKPGVGETTRVLLRRVPWKVLLHPDAGGAVDHIRTLARSRGVSIEIVPDLPFNAVGLIHPVHTPGATDFDGKAAG